MKAEVRAGEAPASISSRYKQLSAIFVMYKHLLPITPWDIVLWWQSCIRGVNTGER